MIRRPIVSSRIAHVTPPWRVEGWPFRPGLERERRVRASGWDGAMAGVLWDVLDGGGLFDGSGVLKSRS